jgi:hypothetical protein
MLIIPEGKKVYIKRFGNSDGGRSIPSNGKPLILEDDITLSFSSRFSPLLGGQANKVLSFLGGIARDLSGGRFGFSGITKHMGFQVWEQTSPISFNATFGFYMGQHDLFDAKREVYDPVMELVKLTLPEVGIGGQLIPPGPSLMSLKEGEGEELTRFYRLGVQIGNVLTIHNALIEKAQPTFSNEVDESGYPLWAKLSMDFLSVELANAEMITGEKLGPSAGEIFTEGVRRVRSITGGDQ